MRTVVLSGCLGVGVLLLPSALGASPAAHRKQSRSAGPAHILSLKVSYRFEEGGRYTRTTRTRYRILDRQGQEGWAHVSATYAPGRMKRPLIRARVTNPDGAEYALDEKAITERPAHEDAPDIYSDVRELRAPLPSVGVGSIIDEEITEEINADFFQGSVAHNMIFQSGVRRDEVELQIDAPATMPLRFEILEADVQKTDETRDGRRRLVFRGGPFVGLEPLEVGTPDEVPAWPCILFSTGRSWADVARAYHDRVRPILDSSAPDGVPMPNSQASLAERVNHLLTFLNGRVRYVGLEFGEGAIIPAAPRETLSRGYGDCKDKATLLIALLARSGVQARLALLRVGPGNDVVEGLPALNVFDHAIVYIPGEHPLWVDPTSPFARAGELPLSDRGRLALVADAVTTGLVRTPVGTASDNAITETREVRMAEQGVGTIVETTEARGVMEQGLRRQLAVEEARTRKRLEEYSADVFGARSVGRIEHGNPADLSERARLVIEAKEAASARTDLLSGRVVLHERVLFGWIPEAAFEGTQREAQRQTQGETQRQTDLVVPFPHQVELKYRVIPPPGYRVAKLPDFPEIDLGPAVLKRHASTDEDGSARVSLSLSVSSTRWTVADLESFRRGMQDLRREGADIVRLEHVSEQMINAHQEAAGIRLLRDPQTGRPRSALDAARLALHLTDLGLGLPAREAADYAARQSPDSALLHRVRGIVWMRDEFGRLFKPGFGREEAIDAFRQTLQRKPDDTFARLQLALLLEHNEAGERYRDRRSLEEAISIYEGIDATVLDEYENGDYASNAIFALMWAGRQADVRQRLRKRPVARTPAVPAIVAEAVLNGTAAGIKEANRLGLKGDDRTRSLKEAVDVLIQQRQYPAAAALLQAVATESGDAGASERRIDMLRRVVPVQPTTLPSATPAEAVRRLLLLQFVGHRVFRPVSEALIALPARNADSGVHRFLAAFADGTRRGDLPEAVLGDIIAAFLQTTHEGDDAGGYRVRFHMQLPGTAKKETSFFVVLEEGMYRVRATEEDLGDVGAQAFAFARRGNRRGAQRWMSWAADVAGRSGGGDPLSVPAWLVLYQSSSAASASELASAALCGKACGADGLRRVEAGFEADGVSPAGDRGAKSGPGKEPWRRDQLLASTYLAHGQFARAMVPIKHLSEAFPASGIARGMLVQALLGAGRYAEVRRLLERDLATASPDTQASVEAQLLSVDAMMGRMDLVKASCGRLLGVGGKASVYNTCAWMGLFADAPGELLLKWVREGDRLSGGKSPATLHTMAVIYAELGRYAEAKETLLKLFEARPPREDDWYIVGRLSEGLGLSEAAETAYRKIHPPETHSPISTYELARRRTTRSSGR